ncbi:MAG: argininosuccinate synthase, partial [Armatimonadetes bacterium]|nr:argininosuccinate synthase [Armatimonadota bacterium]
MAEQVVLAFSGGLDTSWCVPWLREQGHEVITATVDVGGISAEEAAALRVQSEVLGAVDHVHVDAREMYFEEVVRYLLAGNVLRGGTYPLCVGSERALQARESARVATERGAKAVAHGCTAAGNDQVRFDIALRAYAPDIRALAPIRDLAPSRPDQVEYLKQRGLPVPAFGADYSVNSGLWGVTIGGKETKTTDQSIPESAWQRTRGVFDSPV